MSFVFVNGNGLLVNPLVMEEKGLQQGQSIDQEQMWDIITANALVCAAEIDLLRLAGVTGLPDTSDLHALIDNQRT